MNGLVSPFVVFFCVSALLFPRPLSAVPEVDSTVTDFDGLLYHAVSIGAQTWLLENLRSLHHCDGTLVPQAASYSGSESPASICRRLYTWDAAMRGSAQEGIQGGCPCGWLVPTNADWGEREVALRGVAAAGGKLKRVRHLTRGPRPTPARTTAAG